VTVCPSGVFRTFSARLAQTPADPLQLIAILEPMNRQNMSDYKPVSCEAHSIYELAVMQRTAALVRWQEGDAIREARLLAIDVETKNREEFLIAEDSGQKKLRIRLDRILSFEPER
jgi:transcriptional antiterminator Rof (Rho-off)